VPSLEQAARLLGHPISIYLAHHEPLGKAATS
jgi:hypothetical protein